MIRLISTQPISDAKVAAAQQALMKRTGHDVQLSVDAVASKSELTELMERLTRPEPVIPKEKTIAEIRQELMDRVRPAIQEIWPLADAPIQDFDVILDSNRLRRGCALRKCQGFGGRAVKHGASQFEDQARIARSRAEGRACQNRLAQTRAIADLPKDKQQRPPSFQQSVDKVAW